MGVAVSPAASTGTVGIPRSSSRVAGAGTATVPCAMATVPTPRPTGPADTSGWPRSDHAAQVPTMSTRASIAPTSWKCTWSISTPWTAASARASSSKVRRAPRLIAAGRSASASRASMTDHGRWCWPSSAWTVTEVAVNPLRVVLPASRVHPPIPREPTAARTASSEAPRSTRAASSMSPATPTAGLIHSPDGVRSPVPLTATRTRGCAGPRTPRRSRCRCRRR